MGMNDDRTMTADPLDTGAELARLRTENARLRAANSDAFRYIRAKTDQLLEVLGTKSLNPEELDDNGLVAFDPIGIVAGTFRHVLDTLRTTNSQLRAAHDEIQAIFDTVGAALLVLDPTRRIQAWNQQAARLLVGDGGCLHGQDCREAVCHGGPSEDQCTFRRVMVTGRETVMPGVRLGERIFDVIGRPLLNDAGEISQVVLAYQDITAYRQNEAALRHALAETREAQTKIQGILRAAADGLILTDGRSRIVLINHRAERLFGIGPVVPGELPPFRIIRHAGLIDLLRRAPHHKGEFLAADLDFPDQAGREHIYQARVTIIRGPRGGFRGCITSLHDVTEQRQVERMKSEFVSTAAHELRTPLATILGYADLLLNCPELVEGKLEEYLTLIQHRAEHLAHIVSDLLDISRIESGEGLKLVFRSCHLDLICREVVLGLETGSVRHPIEIDFPPGGLTVQGDRFALSQVVENLLSNAIKYTPAGGPIRLAARVDDGTCELVVADRGIGMTAEQLEHLFEKFYRANTADAAVPGTGLGMTIVKHLVEAHHGQVVVESQPGRGTTVRVRLPLVQPVQA
jgi:two-component system phosphate regulon sensor histidine kinase PhoR